MRKRVLSLLLVLAMCITMMPAVTIFAAAEEELPYVEDSPATASNQAPTLKEGVFPTASAQVQVNTAYLLTDLQGGAIFEDKDGTNLNYKSYSYERSSDGGQTWSDRFDFSEALFGWTTIQITETVVGVYQYRFYATDGTDTSTDTWTLTLNVVEEGTWNTKFYVSQDQNYSANGNIYPKIQVYKTAGVDSITGFDYVGWYEAAGNPVYVFNPQDYSIHQDNASSTQWYISEAGTQYELHDYVPVTFTDSTFGMDAANGIASGTVSGGYNMYYASVTTGHYSYRAYGFDAATQDYTVYLGGMSVNIPTDSNVDGNKGGGTDIYLKLQPLGTNSLKSGAVGDYFNADSYYTKIDCPIMGCSANSGTPYVASGKTYYPYMLYAGGNSCLYVYYTYVKEDYPFVEGYRDWSFGSAINRTVMAGTSAANPYTVNLEQAIRLSVVVPDTAEAGIYFQYNNFNTKKMTPVVDTVNNGDGTTTTVYRVQKGGGDNWTWRLTDNQGVYVTKAGWMNNYTEDSVLNLSFQTGDATDKKLHDFSGLGKTVSTRDEADLMVNADPSGYTTTSGSEKLRVRAYRFWQIINSDAGNIMVEPDFHYTLLSGQTTTFQTVDGGNTTGNWLDIAPNGTAIVAVNYDAVMAEGSSSHGGLFPATNPERTGVFIVSNNEKGTADAVVHYNRSTSVATSRSAEWDYNFDTWYYSSTDAAPMLNFTVTGSGETAVEYAFVTTDSQLHSTLSDWSTATAMNGEYTVDLTGFRTMGTKGGTVILKMTDSTGTSYRPIRVGECEITQENVTNPGEAIMPGNQVKLTFSGLYRGIHKISGIFNPTTFYLRYSADGAEVNGQLGQYQQMDLASITLTVPTDIAFEEGADTATYSFDNGYVFGSMYAAANPFGFLYSMTDNGVGTNFNAVTVNVMFSRLADAAVTVHKTVTYDLALQVTDAAAPVTDYTMTLTAADGTVLTAGADGIYRNLVYGKYTCVVSADGYVLKRDVVTLGSDTENVDGMVTQVITLEKALPGSWDGTTKSEPACTSTGVYVIRNAAELAWLADQVNTGTGTLSAKLIADIDLAGYPWTPIGSMASPFRGSFDGSGHTILNLAVHYDATVATTPYLGLFGYVKGVSASQRAIVKNLCVKGDITMTSTKSVSTANSGGVCGLAYWAEIRSVISSVDITIDRVLGNWRNVGGVVGYAQYQTAVVNCGYEGTVTGYQYVGGIVGQMDNGTSIDGCYNSGTVTAADQWVGGIVGIVLSSSTAANGPSTLKNCYNIGLVSAANQYAGGIAGKMISPTNTTNSYMLNTIKNCYHAGGPVTGDFAGALVGDLGVYVTAEQMYYCSDSGAVAYAKDGGTHTAVGMTLDEMKAAEFTTALNANADTALFQHQVNGTPVLAWQNAFSVEKPLLGDVDYTGELDSTDAATLLRYLAHPEDAALQKLINQTTADVSGDGKIDSTDATLLLQYLAQLILHFPAEK